MNRIDNHIDNLTSFIEEASAILKDDEFQKAFKIVTAQMRKLEKQLKKIANYDINMEVYHKLQDTKIYNHKKMTDEEKLYRKKFDFAYSLQHGSTWAKGGTVYGKHSIATKAKTVCSNLIKLEEECRNCIETTLKKAQNTSKIKL